jgi:3-hydroxyisobutyrate dehydrogenase-like beta-hydroxyacid dehydrogenase
MVKKALAAGHEVCVYARGRGLEEVKAAGASSVRDYAAVAAQSELLGLCVFRDEQLREVMYDGGALAALKPGAVVVSHTTGSPEVIREIGARAPAGVSVIDATFSGGPAEVAAGTLAIIVGGEAAAIERARPLISAYADRIHAVGPLGHGQMVKLLNNLLFAANLQNAAEILRVAERQGLDTAACARILQDCSGASYAAALFQRAPVEAMLKTTWQYMVKDVATALSTAKEAGVDTAPFASTAAYFAE